MNEIDIRSYSMKMQGEKRQEYIVIILGFGSGQNRCFRRRKSNMSTIFSLTTLNKPCIDYFMTALTMLKLKDNLQSIVKLIINMRNSIDTNATIRKKTQLTQK